MGDRLANVGSLALFVGVARIRPFMSILGMLPIFLIGLAAKEASMGLLFWTLGFGMWAVSLPLQIKMLEGEGKDGWEQGGKKVFGFNIMLGGWITLVVAGDLSFGRLIE